MSSTKIVIIVLVLIGLLFVIFAVTSAVRNDPKPPNGEGKTEQEKQQQQEQLKIFQKKTTPPDWSKTIKGLFSSLQPKIELSQQIYSGNKTERVSADTKKPFRTATFHRLTGNASIVYDDDTPKSNTPLEKMDNPQECTLPQTDSDVKDKQRCSIIALKRGGTLTFACIGNTPCKVEVE